MLNLPASYRKTWILHPNPLKEISPSKFSRRKTKGTKLGCQTHGPKQSAQRCHPKLRIGRRNLCPTAISSHQKSKATPRTQRSSSPETAKILNEGPFKTQNLHPQTPKQCLAESRNILSLSGRLANTGTTRCNQLPLASTALL